MEDKISEQVAEKVSEKIQEMEDKIMEKDSIIAAALLDNCKFFYEKHWNIFVIKLISQTWQIKFFVYTTIAVVLNLTKLSRWSITQV